MLAGPAAAAAATGSARTGVPGVESCWAPASVPGMLGAAGEGGSVPSALGDVTLPVRAGGGGGGGCTAGGGGGGGAATSADLPTEADLEGAVTTFFSSSACAVSTASRVLPCAASCALTAAAAAFCRSRSRSSRSFSSLASLSRACRGRAPPLILSHTEPKFVQLALRAHCWTSQASSSVPGGRRWRGMLCPCGLSGGAFQLRTCLEWEGGAATTASLMPSSCSMRSA